MLLLRKESEIHTMSETNFLSCDISNLIYRNADKETGLDLSFSLVAKVNLHYSIVDALKWSFFQDGAHTLESEVKNAIQMSLFEEDLETVDIFDFLTKPKDLLVPRVLKQLEKCTSIYGVSFSDLSMFLDVAESNKPMLHLIKEKRKLILMQKNNMFTLQPWECPACTAMNTGTVCAYCGTPKK